MFGRLFASAFQFMTVLPINRDFGLDETSFPSISFFFPVTGLFVGCAAAAVYWLFSLAGLVLVGAVCAVVAECALTGCLHTDGLADMCDAFGARKSRERTLEILKDSRIGTFGVVSIVMNLALRVILIYSLAGYAVPVVLILPAVPCISKTAMVMCASLGTYPRESGTGKTFIENIRGRHLAVCTVLAGAITFVFMGWFFALILTGAMLLTGFVLRTVSTGKIGGVTGDILGASNEAGEIIVLFTVLLMEAVI